MSVKAAPKTPIQAVMNDPSNPSQKPSHYSKPEACPSTWRGSWARNLTLTLHLALTSPDHRWEPSSVWDRHRPQRRAFGSRWRRQPLLRPVPAFRRVFRQDKEVSSCDGEVGGVEGDAVRSKEIPECSRRLLAWRGSRDIPPPLSPMKVAWSDSIT